MELIYECTHPPAGIVARNERIAEDEITCVDGVLVTTPARTAFDLGRYQPRNRAVARMDALMRAAPFSNEEVLLLAKRYRGASGVKQLKDALPLVDGGAASPRETWLRLLYMDAGLPKPSTQIPIFDADGTLLRTVDMGWEDFKVLSEYDGDQHRTDRPQYVKDLRVIPKIERLGFIVLRVIKEDRPAAIIRRRLECDGLTRLAPIKYPAKRNSSRLLLDIPLLEFRFGGQLNAARKASSAATLSPDAQASMPTVPANPMSRSAFAIAG